MPGGRRPGAGRPRNTVERAEAIALARRASPAAIRRLVELTHSRNATVAIAACNSLLDRAWGRPVTPVDGDGDGAPIRIEVVTGIARATDSEDRGDGDGDSDAG